jgi:hypothetical protein
MNKTKKQKKQRLNESLQSEVLDIRELNPSQAPHISESIKDIQSIINENGTDSVKNSQVQKVTIPQATKGVDRGSLFKVGKCV